MTEVSKLMNKGKKIFGWFSFWPRNIFTHRDKFFAMSVTKALQSDTYVQSILVFAVSYSFREIFISCN